MIYVVYAILAIFVLYMMAETVAIMWIMVCVHRDSFNDDEE